MKRPESYLTKQRAAILNYMASLGGAHATAAQISGYLAAAGTPVGRTTIYRHLDKLTQCGQLRRFTVDGRSGACYQCADSRADCGSHFHLKCEGCGRLLHLDCDTLGEISRHVLDAHEFEVDSARTVLYGRCGKCLRTEAEI